MLLSDPDRLTDVTLEVRSDHDRSSVISVISVNHDQSIEVRRSQSASDAGSGHRLTGLRHTKHTIILWPMTAHIAPSCTHLLKTTPSPRPWPLSCARKESIVAITPRPVDLYVQSATV